MLCYVCYVVLKTILGNFDSLEHIFYSHWMSQYYFQTVLFFTTNWLNVKAQGEDMTHFLD